MGSEGAENNIYQYDDQGRPITPLKEELNTLPIDGGDNLGINENHLRLVRKGMFAVVNGSGGSARRSRIVGQDIQMAGKTGTSQVGNKVVRNSDVAWEKRDHALFVCFAPFDNPRYAVSVIVEHGGGGSKAAAPIGRDIMLQALYGKLPPLSAYPSSDRGRIRREQKALKLFDPNADIDESDQA